MKTLIPTVKGTREFYPEQMAVRSRLYHQIQSVSASFGYEEYDGPFLEKIDLYAAKSGEELVKEQAFVFADRGGELITLRPELTPSLARMVAQKQGELAFPLRWWSFGPFWRYERPQKGRSREFFQWNIDLIGVNSPEADAEIIAIAAVLFQKAGLTPAQVGININNRRLMDEALLDAGITAEQKKLVFRLIDRRDKLNREAWQKYALELGLSADQCNSIEWLLGNENLWKQSDELCKVFSVLESLGVQDYIHYDAQVIRGLDYYTGTVFEARDLDKEGRAILGGGHYDNLVGDVGGDPLPGVGFAMGDVMYPLVLEKYGLLDAGQQAPADVLVVVFDQDSMGVSQSFAMDLRRAGLRAMCYPEPAKLNKQFKFADRVGIRQAVVMGPDEIAAGKVTIKDLNLHNQETLSKEEAIVVLQRLLAQADCL
ncbi:MAG TPA: histidine--tRNA ligase [Longilinea sp.]|nr:histidine--tRNA ligase [Longilinea sp.]